MDEHVLLFSQRLTMLRTKKGVSLREVGKAVNIGATTICRFENCQRTPKFTMIIKLAEYFEVDPKWLMGCSE